MNEAPFSKIRAQVDRAKHERNLQLAALKIKIPNYLKNFTIQELRAAGGTVDPDIRLPIEAVSLFRTRSTEKSKNEDLIEKLQDLQVQYRNQVQTYFNNAKRTLPQDMLNKQLDKLDKDDWACLGVDILE